MALLRDRSLLLDQDLVSMQTVVREFVQKELLPLEETIEREGGLAPDVRYSLRAKARAIGLWCPSAPEELGGGGLGQFELSVIHEELGAVVSSLGAQSRIVGDDPSVPFIQLASEVQRRNLFEPVINGEQESAVAMTEPEAGSDLRMLRTTATQSPNGDWVINGSKRWISGAKTADYILTLAKTEKASGEFSLTLFAVPTDAQGFAIGADEMVAGRHGISENELIFDNCTVSKDAVIGGTHAGLEMAGRLITPVRLAVASHSVGTIHRLLTLSSDYSRNRCTFGKPLADRQAIQWKLAEMAVSEVTCRAYVRRCAQMLDAGLNSTTEVALAKLIASRAAFSAADETMQIFGGLGYSSEMPIERVWRDTRLYRIVDGADEILTRMIARDVLTQQRPS